VRRWHWLAMGLLLLVSVVAGLLVHHEPAPGHWWDGVAGFYAVYGFAGCILIVFGSRLLGKMVLERREDYYEAADGSRHGEGDGQEIPGEEE